jgi:hypothetical protein
MNKEGETIMSNQEEKYQDIDQVIGTTAYMEDGKSPDRGDEISLLLAGQIDYEQLSDSGKKIVDKWFEEGEVERND